MFDPLNMTSGQKHKNNIFSLVHYTHKHGLFFSSKHRGTLIRINSNVDAFM